MRALWLVLTLGACSSVPVPIPPEPPYVCGKPIIPPVPPAKGNRAVEVVGAWGNLTTKALLQVDARLVACSDELIKQQRKPK
jgi:hypothetical protein